MISTIALARPLWAPAPPSLLTVWLARLIATTSNVDRMAVVPVAAVVQTTPNVLQAANARQCVFQSAAGRTAVTMGVAAYAVYAPAVVNATAPNVQTAARPFAVANSVATTAAEEFAAPARAIANVPMVCVYRPVCRRV
jgi:hypothetical protein